MKTFSLLFLFLLTFTPGLSGQVILEEDFNYPVGDSLHLHNWISYNGTQKAILVTEGSLSYPGYPSSDTGNSTTIYGGGKCRESVYRNFQEQNTVYVSLLVNVCYADPKGDFFFQVGESFPTENFGGNIYVKDDCNGNLLFGLSRGIEAEAIYSPITFSYGTTHLLVLKYVSVGDSSSDDTVKLYVDPFITLSEPDTSTLTSIDTVADISVGGVALRQRVCSKYKIQIDGLRITTLWNEITPVELTSFTASAINEKILLRWKTETELNNSGFEIERKSSLLETWAKVAFISGYGTTTNPKEYSYTDNLSATGIYLYRLKQIDFNGSYEYSSAVEINYKGVAAFDLSQNYPNPFNPATTIKFSFEKNTLAELKVFDVLGKEVSTLFNETAAAGKIYEVDFNASTLVSGVYYYRLSGDGRTGIKKMIFLK